MWTKLRTNAERFLELFAAVLPLAFLSPTFSLFVVSAPSGLTEDLANLVSAVTLTNMFSYRIIEWAITATIFTSIGIMVFGRRIQTFWISALVWGASCFLTDVLTTPPSNLSTLNLIVIVIGDINLGGPLGGLYIWVVSSRIGRRYARDTKQSPPKALVAAHGQITIGMSALLTGFAGMNLIAFLWVWATIGTMSILITYPAFQSLLTRLWAARTTLPVPVLIGINFVAASVSLTIYLLIIAGVRRSVYVMLGSRSRVAIFCLAVTAVVAAVADLMTPLVYQIGPKTSAKSGWSCSMREKRCISGPSLVSGIVGISS